MKAKLEFDLEDYHDRLSHRRCTNATLAYLALWDIGQLLEREKEITLDRFLEVLESRQIDLSDLE